MSQASEALLRGTSKEGHEPALLVFEDGTCFRGTSCAAPGETIGEVCFNTSMEGYLEVVTDPSYAGQIVTLTYPQIGAYGIHPEDVQAQTPSLRALIVRDMVATPSSWRAAESLPAFLKRHNVVALEGVDTRALVRHVRTNGAQQAIVSTLDLNPESLLAKLREAPPFTGQNFVEGVSRAEAATFNMDSLPASHTFARPETPKASRRVVAYDCGMKDAIGQALVRAGCEVCAVPWDTPAEEVLALAPDGVFLSNGPGDPDAVDATYTQVERLLGQVPVFGICLGHQMIAKACGAAIEKLPFGHHGGNHPVMNLVTNQVEVTAQNHGFGLNFASLGPLVPELSGGATAHEEDLRAWVRRRVAPVVQNPRFGRIRLTHVNLGDGTAEGMQLLDVPAFSVQYHPEAAPGPADSAYLFDAFLRLMEGDADCLAPRKPKAVWRYASARPSTESEAAHA